MTDEKILNKIMTEYEQLRSAESNERDRRIKEVRWKYPQLDEIEKEIFRRGFENTNNILKNPENANEYNKNFKEQLKILNEKKRKIIKENNIPEDYDGYHYRCEKCHDTGYDENGKKCSCFIQKLINEAYSMSNMEDIVKKQNFDTFSFDYYSKQKNTDGISPYENMVKIYNKCRKFCENFDNEEKSILFYGQTGLGKTFLSSAIAKELMDKGKTVVYTRATKLFMINDEYRFGKNTDKSIIDNIYNADLLIIDDLGTEPINKINLAFLLDIINERILQNKKMIINTNLQIREITQIYSMRFTSRLYGNFMFYKFFGNDIRIQKFKDDITSPE